MSVQDLVRRVALVLAICVAFSLNVQGEAYAHKNGQRHHHARSHNHRNLDRPHKKHHKRSVVKIDSTTFEEYKCMALNARFEADKRYGRLLVSQRLISMVVRNRWDLVWKSGNINPYFRWLFGGETMCEVVFSRQFSWTWVCPSCQKWIRLQEFPKDDESDSAQKAALDVFEGWRPEDDELDPELLRAVYYVNPDPQYVRPAKLCKFRQSYVRLAKGEQIGGHEFYALPTETEYRLIKQRQEEKEDAIRRLIAQAKKERGEARRRLIAQAQGLAKACDPVDAITIEAKNP